jgi:hypothetical protein
MCFHFERYRTTIVNMHSNRIVKPKASYIERWHGMFANAFGNIVKAGANSER